MEKDNARKNNSNNITEHHIDGQSSVVFDYVINNELFCALMNIMIFKEIARHVSCNYSNGEGEKMRLLDFPLLPFWCILK